VTIYARDRCKLLQLLDGAFCPPLSHSRGRGFDPFSFTNLEVLSCFGARHLADFACLCVRLRRSEHTELEELSIPITAERGRDGGYRHVSGYNLPPTRA
jgi:hypothetical protein